MANENYETKDPWGYQDNPNDAVRKRRIIAASHAFGPFNKVLDIGCGEAWITKDLPGKDLYGYEPSGNARKRFPYNVYPLLAPTGVYDLVLTSGTLYPHYDYQSIIQMVRRHTSNIFITCNIVEWQVKENFEPMRLIYLQDFKYGSYTQQLRVFKVDV